MNRRAILRHFLSAMAAPIAAVLPRRTVGGWSYVAIYDPAARMWNYSNCVNCHVGEDGKMRFPETAMTAPHSPVALT